jgi:glycerophosphoryl diester phosphodiesterase
MTKFYNIGHRGASAYAHENTMASFEEAISRGADMIEFDLRRTSDGVIVVFHNKGIQLNTGQIEPISKIRYVDLQASAQNQGFEIPTFEDVLKSFGPRIPLNIEIKLGGLEKEVIRLLKEYPPAFEPTLSSFLPWVVICLKRSGNFKTALIIGEGRIHKLNILERRFARWMAGFLGISAIHLQDSIASQAAFTNLTQTGLAVVVWTVDEPEIMRRFLMMGVDGIITNKPDLLYGVCLEMSNSNEPILKKINNNSGRFVYAV